MESFPHALETTEGARRYICAFRAPLQELSMMSLVQIHTLRACSLLVIPPPEERMPVPGGFPLGPQFVRLGHFGPRCGIWPAGATTQSGQPPS